MHRRTCITAAFIVFISLATMGCNQEERQWRETCLANEEGKYVQFAEAYPKSTHVPEARQLADECAFNTAKSAASEAVWLSYIERYPSSRHIDEAKQSADDSCYTEAAGRQVALLNYLESYTNGRHRAEALNTLDRLDWETARQTDSISALRGYQDNHPKGAYRQTAEQRILQLVEIEYVSRCKEAEDHEAIYEWEAAATDWQRACDLKPSAQLKASVKSCQYKAEHPLIVESKLHLSGWELKSMPGIKTWNQATVTGTVTNNMAVGVYGFRFTVKITGASGKLVGSKTETVFASSGVKPGQSRSFSFDFTVDYLQMAGDPDPAGEITQDGYHIAM